MVYACKVVQFRTLPHLTTSKVANVFLRRSRRTPYTSIHHGFRPADYLTRTFTSFGECAPLAEPRALAKLIEPIEQDNDVPMIGWAAYHYKMLTIGMDVVCGSVDPGLEGSRVEERAARLDPWR